MPDLVQFDQFELDLSRFELRRDGVAIAMEPQVFDVLVHLVRAAGRVVSKEELFDEVWGTRFVTDSALTTRIKMARRVLGDDGQEQRYIRTVHRRGYEFVGTVRTIAVPAHGEAPRARPLPAATVTAVEATPPSRTGRWPFTGRSRELEVLGEIFRGGDASGVLIVGPAGVGKTRLVEEALVLAERVGRPIARAVGHPAAREIPLGALAHLLPRRLTADIGVDAEERTAFFHAARSELAAMAGDDRLVVFVDDADLLDDTSVALLVPLIVARTVFFIGTIRSGRTPSRRLASLQRDGYVRRVELQELAGGDVSALLHRALDGPVSERALAELERLSGGNLQILTELVRGARERGALVRDGETWDLVGPLAATVELTELVAEHLGAVDDAARAVLEMLAVCERLGVADLEEEFGAEQLEQLESRGLLEFVQSERRSYLRLAHPLYGEVLSSQLPELRRRAIRRRLADLVERHGARRREDRVRVVLWRLDSGGTVEPRRALQAARLALVAHDSELAERLLRDELPAGTNDAVRGERLQVLGEAAALQGHIAETERRLGDALALALPDTLRCQIAVRLADTRFFGGRDLDGALRACRETAARLQDPAGLVALDVERAVLLANAGRPVDALAIIDRLPAELDRRTAIDVAVARSASLIAAGRCGEGAEVARWAAREQEALPEWLSQRGAARHVLNEAHALGYAGNFRPARELLAQASVRARASGANSAWIWFEMALGEVARDMGRGAECVRHCATVVEHAAASGQEAALVWAHVGVAQGHLLQGRRGDAARALEQAERVGASPLATSRATLERTAAWLLACGGDLPGARQRLLTTAADMHGDGIVLFEAALLHDVARFGAAGDVVERLEALGGELDGPIFPFFALHARALATGDAEALEACVDGFEELDSLALAAEAAAELAEVLRRSGQQRAASAAGQRSAAIAARAGGVATPPMARGDGPEPLTTREREIAMLAASGLASREIGQRLFVSTRTVDTHLARVYRKLGLSSRAELASAMDPSSAAPPA
jgi:DNA-binding winged helix-turn-helix (wHTH) protein/DNA-binding CsgD family transcriptional regulator